MPKYIVGIDTETFLFTEENPIPKLVCCSICVQGETNLYKHDDPLLEEVLENILKNQDQIFVAHNASFDFMVLALQFPQFVDLINTKYYEGNIICTKLYEKLLRLQDDGIIDRKEFSLAYCVEKYLGIDVSATKTEDSWRLNYDKLVDIPIEEWEPKATEYAKKDAEYTRSVFFKQFEIKKIKNVRVQSHCDWLGEMITKVEGLKVDQVFLEERLAHFQEIIKSQDTVLLKHNFKGAKSKNDPTLKKNTSVIKEAVQECYKKLGVPVPTTDKGNISCDAESLDGIQGLHEGIDALIALGSSGTAVNTFLLNWQGKQEVKPSLDILKSTGRMSCYNPNLQNVNREGRIRGCFVPREGYVYCSSDYGQLELLTFAQVAFTMFKDLGQPCLMREAINAGKDLHCMIGADIAGEKYESFFKAYKEKGKPEKRLRQMGKAGNFGLIGGLGLDTFISYAKTSYDVILTRDEAQLVFNSFFNSFPEAKFYLKYIENFKISKDIGTFYRCEQLFTDRVRMVPESQYCSACNTFFQGLASDIVKDAFVELMNATMFGKMQAIVKLLVHDEFIFEIPREVAHEEVKKIDEIMRASAKKFLPDIDIIKVESCLMNRWEKQAEPVFENGILVPWEYEKHGVKV